LTKPFHNTPSSSFLHVIFGYSSDNCTGFKVEGHCFIDRRQLVDTIHCDEGEYLGHDGFCYYTTMPNCNGSFINCACYKFNSTALTYRSCVNIQGIGLIDDVKVETTNVVYVSERELIFCVEKRYRFQIFHENSPSFTAISSYSRRNLLRLCQY